VRGKVVHSVLENFFKVCIANIHQSNYEFELKTLLIDMFRQEWEQCSGEFDAMKLGVHDRLFYFNETKKMLENWFNGFNNKLKECMATMSLVDSFAYLTPKREIQYVSPVHKVQGFIDAVYEWADGVHILDYKTSSKDEISPEYRLQLGIYALLYHEKHSVRPASVGINFLKFGEKFLEVDDLLIEEAKRACVEIHERTISDDKCEYPKQASALCKWSTGQCDFYEHCIDDD
jgi:ATP-dependent exoDNAse (exonuclease V) beta subunit